MAQQIIFGSVNADGTIKGGSGFKVVPDTDKGVYNIVFDTSFNSFPSVVSTQNYPDWSDFTSGGGNTTDNSVIVALDNNKFKVKVGDSDGSGRDRNFSFIAVGS